MIQPSLALIPTGYKDGKLYSVLPESGAGDFDVVRGSGATRINKEGLIESVADNTPRLDYTGGGCPSLLLEPLSTNLIVNSELNNVENISVSAVAYTISFYGTGSITLSGAHTATLSGTGANDRVTLTFTPSAGTLICTDSGSVDNKQVETLPYATSYIPTSGQIATRLADSVTGAGDATTFNSTEGVLYAEIAALADDGTIRRLAISDGSNNNRVFIGYDTPSKSIIFAIQSLGALEVYQSFNISDTTQFSKIAIKYKENDCSFWIDGVKVGTGTAALMPTGLSSLRFTQGDTTRPLYGKVKSVITFNTALTDAELECLTTI